jgi:replication factor C small subunit
LACESKNIHRQIFDLKLPEKSKLDLIEQVGEFEFRLNQGGSPEIQLEALLAQFLKHGKS